MADVIMKKSHNKSYFRRFHITSELAKQLFCSGSSEIILQIMECDDGELIAELVNRNDYQEAKNNGE